MPTAPYDTLETILQSARVRLNDAIQSISGDILTDTAAFTPQAVNNAWRRLQEYLTDRGFSALSREVIFTNVPPLASTDPGVFAWISWANFFDGAALYTSPVLPQDLISPLSLYERVNGSNSSFFPMDQALNGLPTPIRSNLGLNQWWEWRGEALYLLGGKAQTDIRLRYAAYLADFASPIAPTTPVPIMRCLNSFAWYICSEMARARGDMDAGTFDQFAMDAAEQIWNRDYQEGKRLFKRAELGKMADARSRTQGENSPAEGVSA